MFERDNCRKRMKGASTFERKILHLKYKKLRIKATANLRKDNLKLNSERMQEAKDKICHRIQSNQVKVYSV